MLFYLLLAFNQLQSAVDRLHDPVRHLGYDLGEQVFVYSQDLRTLTTESVPSRSGGEAHHISPRLTTSPPLVEI